MGNYDETAKYIKEHPVFSLLPIRFYNDGDWNLKGLYNFSSVGTYRDGFLKELWPDVRSISSVDSSQDEMIKHLAKISGFEYRERGYRW